MFPVLFVSHGSPDLTLMRDPLVDFLSKWAKGYKKPKAIVIVSAHMEERKFTLLNGETHDIEYDFYGFPDELYQSQYPARGEVTVAEEIAEILEKNNIPYQKNPHGKWDHGVWSPLSLLYPDADIPIVQISLHTSLDEQMHYNLGKALSSLREQDILCIGSGSVTHNLRHMDYDESQAFADFITRNIEENNTQNLIRWKEKAPYAKTAHPRSEHFIPLFFALGCGQGLQGKKVHESTVRNTLHLTCYEWK